MLANAKRTPCRWLVFASATLYAGPVEAGKLDDIRHETSSSSSEQGTPASSSDSDEGDDDDDDEDDDGGSILLGILQAIFNSDDQASGGDVAVPAGEEPPGPRPMYLAYPYVAGQPGSLRFVTPGCSSVGLKQARVQVWGEGAGDWAGLYRGTLGVSGQLAGSLGFETRGSLWYEPLVGRDDQLFFWDNDLWVELAPSVAFQTYLGAGFRVMLDPTGRSRGVAGGHGLLRFDVYPAEPLVVHLGTTLGVLGKAFMFEGQGTVGVQLIRAELYAGYSVWAIEQTVLHGPLAGIRTTF
jgi:hypothetical protein